MLVCVSHETVYRHCARLISRSLVAEPTPVLLCEETDAFGDLVSSVEDSIGDTFRIEGRREREQARYPARGDVTPPPPRRASEDEGREHAPARRCLS